MPEVQKIQWRRGTAATWTTANPVLSEGTPGFETDTGKFKVGDGVKDWKTLAYQGGGGAALTEVTNKAALPAAGVAGNLYVAKDTGGLFRWDGAKYVSAVAPHRWVSVADFGALGDGVADDTAAFTAAAATGQSVFVPPGKYLLSAMVTLVNNQKLWCAPGVEFKATATMAAMFYAKKAHNVWIVGNGARFDLNSVAESAVTITSVSTTKITGVHISGVHVFGNDAQPAPTANAAAIMVMYAVAPVVSDVHVSNIGHDPATTKNVYALKFYGCSDVNVSSVLIVDCRVGVDFGACDGMSMTQFTLRNLRDNGIYILTGSNNVRISNGVIDNAEEGIAVASDDVTITGVSFLNCINKGVTLRHTDRTKIIGCDFVGNAVHIGDSNDGKTTKFLKVSDCTFKDATTAGIQLTATTLSEFDNLTMTETVAAGRGALRLNNGSGCVIRNSRFSFPGKAGVVISHASVGAVVRDNIFSDVTTAVDLVADTSGVPSNTVVSGNRYESTVGSRINVGTATGTVVADTDELAVKVPVPASATAAGRPGMIAVDATHVYVCTAPNSWVRATAATW